MVWMSLAAIVVLVLLMFAGVISADVTTLAHYVGMGMLLLAVGFFGYVLAFAKISAVERGRVAVIAIFFLCAAMFWAGFEQAATTLNLFAQDYTDRSLLGGFFPEGVHPASWYQSANPIYIILGAPLFAWMWVALGKRNLDPSAPAKFGLGLVQLGLGFVVMVFAAKLVLSSGGKVAPTWLMLTYLLHTMGELCLSPVGLSNVTKLSPPQYVGQMMGTWFLGAALGNLAAGLIGGHIGGGEVSAMPGQFLTMAFVAGGAGLVMLLASPVIKRMTGGVT